MRPSLRFRWRKCASKGMGGCVSCNAGNEPGAQEATVASGAPQRDKAAARAAARRAKRATGPIDPLASAKAVQQANEEGLELLRSSDQPSATPKKSTGFQNVGKIGDRYFATIEVDGKTVRCLADSKPPRRRLSNMHGLQRSVPLRPSALKLGRRPPGRSCASTVTATGSTEQSSQTRWVPSNSTGTPH